MAEETKTSIFKEVDLHIQKNNFLHRTYEISRDSRLIVRRGQSFQVTLHLTKPFNSNLHSLTLTAKTGKHPTEEKGTLSFFSIPDPVRRPASTKPLWKMELKSETLPSKGKVVLDITPSADVPIGEYILTMKHRDEETLLAKPVVLFNPWCSDDSVYMEMEENRKEYVMNEQGIVYRGSQYYIMPLDWDFGQFEDDMVDICLKLLDLNTEYLADAAKDVAARSDPGYVGRVISAMINAQDDFGVLAGRWDGNYDDGRRPGHWTGSHAILKQWFKNEFKRVKYGQCWVFACVMCSVMRLLGIPCRVITNFESAHDCDKNLTIDVFYSEDGMRERQSYDSVWNFHVWTEGWMKRPDLTKKGEYDGWQVLDPTPQELSGDIYRCGPAPVKAILSGETALKYDVPFVFAEVNADCIDWLVKADGSMVTLSSDTKRVGQNISTKAVGSSKRIDVTNKYKYKEGSAKERAIFKHATTRDYSRVDDDEEMEEEEGEEEEIEETNEEENVEVEEAEGGGPATEEDDEPEGTVDADEEEEEEETPVEPLPKPVIIKFEEVTPPTNGKDVRLRLLLQSKSTAARQLSINISVQAMRYTGTPAATIQKEVKERTLEPGQILSIPIRVPFAVYHKSMLDCDNMKVSVIVTDKEKPENPYLANDDVVLLDPPISVTVNNTARVNQMLKGQVVFMNPTGEMLKECTLTLSGSGIWRDEREYKLGQIPVNCRVRVTFYAVPYKAGKKTIMADFDCSVFRDIKGHCNVNIKE